MKHYSRYSMIMSILPLLAVGIRIAIINDMHLNKTESVQGEIGEYGRDSKTALFKLMTQDMRDEYHNTERNAFLGKEEGKIDLVLVLGDFVAHDLSSKDPNVNNWHIMKPVILEQLLSLEALFPDVPILGTIGNNDVI